MFKLKNRFVILVLSVFYFLTTGFSQNIIINGGAERGWYMTGRIPVYSGKPVSFWQAHEWRIADEGYNSRHSFNIDYKKEGFLDLFFNPVEMETGKPYYISLYAKASKDNAGLRLTFYRSSGSAYIKTVKLTKNWQQYTMIINSHGLRLQKDTEISALGGFSDANPDTGTVKMLPRVVPADEAEYWVDCVQAGSGAVPPLYRDEDIFIRGQPDRDTFEYRPGEKADIVLEIENNKKDQVNLALGYKIFDYNNQEIAGSSSGNLSLAPAECKKYPVTIPVNTAGPLTIIFTAVTGNNKIRHGVRINCVEPFSQKYRDGRGIGIDSSHNTGEYSLKNNLLKNLNIIGSTDILVKTSKTYGMGIMRFWMNKHTYTEEFFKDTYISLEMVKKAGIKTYVVINKAVTEEIKNEWLLPKDPRLFSTVVNDIVKGHETLFDYLEILNEPNIWGGRIKNTYTQTHEDVTTGGYVNLLNSASAVLKNIDPRIKVAGPAIAGMTLSWIDAVLAGGAGNLDAVSFHSYKIGPDNPDFQAQLRSMHASMDRYGNGKRQLIQSEGNWLQESITPHWEISSWQRTLAERNVKSVIIGYANRLDYFILFDGKLQNTGGTVYTVYMCGNPGNNCMPVAQPVLPALKALQDRLLHAYPVREIFIADSLRCYLFKKENEYIAPIWIKNEKHEKAASLLIPFKGNLGCFDIMGNRVSAEKKTSGYNIAIKTVPAYLHFQGDEKEITASLEKSAPSGIGFPAETGYRVNSGESIGITVKNTGGQTISGKITFAGKDREEILPQEIFFPGIPRGSNINIACRLKRPFSIKKPLDFIIRTVLESEEEWGITPVKLKAHFCPYRKGILIDGEISDWKDISAISLEKDNYAKSDKTGTDIPEKFSARIGTAWNEEGLYILAVVSDPVFSQDWEESAMWKGDSLQLAFDTLQNGGTLGYRDDDFEYGISLTPKGPQVFCFTVSSPGYDGFTGKKTGLTGMPVSIKRKGTDTVYEIHILPNWLSPFSLKEGNTMNWNLIINNNDGQGRTGWLEITPGIGQTPKAPGDFSTIILTK